VQGKEVFRIEPFSGNVGIGNYSQTSTKPPGNANYIGAKLDIDGDLRIRTVAPDNALNQVLVRDPNDLGRVHWRDAASLGGLCEWNIIDNGANDHLAMGYSGACNLGNVGIGTGTPQWKLSVVNDLAGASGNTVFVSSANNGAVFNYGINAQATGGTAGIVGVGGSAFANGAGVGGTPLIGVRGIADALGQCFYNAIGVYGQAIGNPGCGGVTAGYFAGTVVTNGAIINISDEAMKTNIVEQPSVLDGIMSFKPHCYEFQTENYPSMGLDEGTHHGLLAQEVANVFPNLVKPVSYPGSFGTDGEYLGGAMDLKGVNYIELIPILVKGMQEQQAKIDELQAQLNSCCIASADIRSMPSDENVVAQEIRLSNQSIVLNQNVPNPFAEQTTISYSINEDFSKAQILFYDANGRLIQVTDIAGKGFGQLNIFADDLTTGVYSYALVVDGKVIETKKMVKQ
jgi:Chaperone of endosialidase